MSAANLAAALQNYYGAFALLDVIVGLPPLCESVSNLMVTWPQEQKEEMLALTTNLASKMRLMLDAQVGICNKLLEISDLHNQLPNMDIGYEVVIDKSSDKEEEREGTVTKTTAWVEWEEAVASGFAELDQLYRERGPIHQELTATRIQWRQLLDKCQEMADEKAKEAQTAE